MSQCATPYKYTERLLDWIVDVFFRHNLLLLLGFALRFTFRNCSKLLLVKV